MIMKSADDWIKEMPENENLDGELEPYCDELFIRQIQLDAMREGAWRAAEATRKNNANIPVGNVITFQNVADELAEEIIVISKCWTEKDL